MTNNKRVSKILTGDQALGVISNFGPLVPTELRMADEDLPIKALPPVLEFALLAARRWTQGIVSCGSV
jgi:hypothetical protein